MAAVHAFGGSFEDDALGNDDAVGLVEKIRSGRVSSSELVEAAIARVEAVNPALNGLAYEAFDAARREAGTTNDAFFAGLPTFVKDNIDVKGMPTMSGTDAWAGWPAKAHSEFTSAFLGTGLVPLGKTRMSEFGFSASAEHPRLGAVRNPWNTEHTAGASSSGSGAFVAAGAVPIAHANDGGGSIRIPASCNGLVGLKPSRGRLPLDKQMRQMPIRIIFNGVLTRSVRDTAAFYREAERSFRHPKLRPIGDVTGPGSQRLKVAVLTTSVFREAAPEVRELTWKTAKQLEELGHHVEAVDKPPVPGHFPDDFLLYWALLAFALVRSGRQTFGPSFDRDKLDNLTLGLEKFAGRNLHKVPLAIARLKALRRRSARFFRTYDVVLTPTVADETPRIGHLDPTAPYEQTMERLIEWVAFTPLQNVTGAPVISLPLATTSAGLPIGMMVGADVGRERRLLELAYELEEAHPFARIQAG